MTRARGGGTGVKADPHLGQPVQGSLGMNLPGQVHRGVRVIGADQDGVADHLDELAASVECELLAQLVETQRQLGAALVTVGPGVLGEVAQVGEHEGVG